MEQPNLDYINTLAGDDEDFKAILIKTIKTELPQEIAAYTNSYTGGDYKTCAEHVHKLKHKISILGLEKSYYLAAEFEDQLKNNENSLAPDFEAILQNMATFTEGL